MNDPYLQIARQILASQPFSVLLGTEVVQFSAGQAELRLLIKPEFMQQFDTVHGGVLSYIADNALTFAGGSVLGTQVATASMTIAYVRPAHGEALIARASVITATSRQAVCRCDVFARQGEQETLCATAQGTIISLAERQPREQQ